MNKIEFTKFSGSGNDFIFIDNRNLEHRADEMIDFVQRVCRRGQSVGADGLMFIEPSERADFKWRFFNADGSEGEMCGNGGRCAARFARELGIATDSVSFETIAGVIDATMSDSRVKLRMTQPFDYRAGIRLDINGRGVLVDHMNTGVPMPWNSWTMSRTSISWPMGGRFGPMVSFAPAGANANFARVSGDNSLVLRTYERGVENETLACGTGAVATAVLAATRGLVTAPVDVQVRSGEILKIYFEGVGAEVSDVYMEGETRLVYQGEMTEEAFL